MAALTLAFAVGGCGGAGKKNVPDLRQLPLVPGAQVVARVQECDSGANSFCAIEFVIVDRHYHTSTDLLEAEHKLIRSRGWLGADADTGDQKAADSPGHKLRVTYATAYGDLKGIDLEWIKRPRPITLALSRALFERASALSMMLELGST